MQKTPMITTIEAKHNWHLLDAQGLILGRFATKVARLLMGKNKVDYTPHIDNGDFVVIINSSKIAVTGNKKDGKIYYSYSGFPSGLSESTFAELMEKSSDKIIRSAVHKMLPDNKLRSIRMDRLKIYADAEHKHESQLQQK